MDIFTRQERQHMALGVVEQFVMDNDLSGRREHEIDESDARLLALLPDLHIADFEAFTRLADEAQEAADSTLGQANEVAGVRRALQGDGGRDHLARKWH